MAEDSASYFYPNRIGRSLLRGLEKQVGLEGLLAVLEGAGLSDLANNYPPADMELGFPFDVVSALQGAVEDIFGIDAGRQLNREVGHLMIEGGLSDFGPMLGITDLAERTLPVGMKLRLGLDTLAELFNRFGDQVVRLSEDTHHYLWVIERCPVCWGRQSDAPCCQLAVGILEQGLAWATGGQAFRVDEIECIAAGGETCTLFVSKQPGG